MFIAKNCYFSFLFPLNTILATAQIKTTRLKVETLGKLNVHWENSLSTKKTEI